MSDWGISNTGFKPVFYVFHQGQGTYNDPNFTFTGSYQIRQNTGSTYNSDIVAPMQMFVVGTEVQKTLTIPASKRTHGNVNYLRSAANRVVDELLIETTDSLTKGYDRMCIVFRNTASLKADDMYDAVKIFNSSGGVNQIYTRSTDNKDLTVSVVPTHTQQLVMYFEPASQTQIVTLKADRLNSLVSVSGVVLEDTKTGKHIDLMSTPVYTFTASPVDKADRFILRFGSTPTGVDHADPVNTKLLASYDAGTLYVRGLQENDKGCNLTLFNMQGQRIFSQPVTDTSSCRIQHTLKKGIYILKVKENSIKLSVN
jgi:hypothetical protein